MSCFLLVHVSHHEVPIPVLPQRDVLFLPHGEDPCLEVLKYQSYSHALSGDHDYYASFLAYHHTRNEAFSKG